MTSVWIALVVFASMAVGAVLGVLLRAVLPEPHRNDESKDVVRICSGLVATLVALILGLLIASAKGSFDAENTAMIQASSRVILLNRALTRYGPEANEANEALRHGVALRVEQIWPSGKPETINLPVLERSSPIEHLQDLIRSLRPASDDQRLWRDQATQLITELAQARWLMIMQAEGGLPTLFIGVLMFWLVALFISFGLFAPRNATVSAALLICALSVSGAVFLIVEMSHPLQGTMKVSDAPLRRALEIIDQK